MTINERYNLILKDLTISNIEIESMWKDLLSHYSEKFRKYHNIEHLEQMFYQYDLYKAKVENPLEVAISIFYHDIIYQVSRKDNEAKSADYAKNLFKNKEINMQIIKDLILATKDHNAKTNDEKFMVDFGLSILGQNGESYLEYCKKIRKEYRIYPNLIYNPGRKKVLMHFLEKERIFQTDIFYQQFEKKARLNLQTELDSL